MDLTHWAIATMAVAAAGGWVLIGARVRNAADAMLASGALPHQGSR